MGTELILGTAQFGLEYGINNLFGKPSEQQVFNILRYAEANGIRTLDTANAYGNAMEIIGKYHRTNKNKFRIISKFHLPDKLQELNPERELTGLAIPQFEAYLFHSFQDYENAKSEVFDVLSDFKKNKLINSLGLSVYTNEQFEKAIYDERLDLIQFPLNLLDNLSNRKKYIDLARTNGKLLHSRSAFLQGLFFKKFEQYPELLKPLAKYQKELENIASTFGLTMSQLALSYIIQSRAVEGVLIGVETLEQLKTNLNDSRKVLSGACMEAVNKIEVEEKELLNPVNWNKHEKKNRNYS